GVGWEVADVNGDGLSDLILPHWREPHPTEGIGFEHLHLLVALSLGTGQFVATETVTTLNQVGNVRWQLGDVNGDGKADLVFPYWHAPDSIGYDHFHAYSLFGQSNGQFTPADWHIGWGNVGSRWHLADVNGDGKSDLVLPSYRQAHGSPENIPYEHIHVL